MFKRRKKRAKKKKVIIDEEPDVPEEPETTEPVEGPEPPPEIHEFLAKRAKKKKKKKSKMLTSFDEADEDVFTLKKEKEKKRKKKKKKKRRSLSPSPVELPPQETQPSYSAEELKRLQGLAKTYAKPEKKSSTSSEGSSFGLLNGILAPEEEDDDEWFAGAEDPEMTEEQIQALKIKRRRKQNGTYIPTFLEGLMADESGKRKMQANQFADSSPAKRRKLTPPPESAKFINTKYASKTWNVVVDDFRNVPSPAAIRWNIFNTIKLLDKTGKRSENSLHQTQVELEVHTKELKDLTKQRDAENKRFLFFQKLQDDALAYVSCCEAKVPMINNAMADFRKTRESHRQVLDGSRQKYAELYYTGQRYMENGLANLIDEHQSQKHVKDRELMVETMAEIFSDATDKLQSVHWFLGVLQEWKTNFPVSYFQAYVPDSLPKLVAPFVRLELAQYNPSKGSFTSQDWYEALLRYTQNADDDDADVAAVPVLIHKFVMPAFIEHTRFEWDCYNLSETRALLKEIHIIDEHFEDDRDYALMQKNLFKSVHSRLQKVVEEHSKPIRVVPEFPVGSDQSNFCVFWWRQALTLLKTMELFKTMLSEKVVKGLIEKIVSTLLFPFHAHVSLTPLTKKTVNRALIELMAFQTQQLAPLLVTFNYGQKTLSAQCSQFLRQVQKQDAALCRQCRVEMEHILKGRDF